MYDITFKERTRQQKIMSSIRIKFIYVQIAPYLYIDLFLSCIHLNTFQNTFVQRKSLNGMLVLLSIKENEKKKNLYKHGVYSSNTNKSVFRGMVLDIKCHTVSFYMRYIKTFSCVLMVQH